MERIGHDLPNDVESLKALLVAARVENARLAARNERLDHIIAVLRCARFGRSSERIDGDQLNLALEDVETASERGCESRGCRRDCKTRCHLSSP